MGETPQIQVCQACSIIPKKTRFCNRCQRCFNKVLSKGSEDFYKCDISFLFKKKIHFIKMSKPVWGNKIIEASDPGEEYVMSYNLRGLALIFNQEYFSPELRLPHRHGTKADKNNLLRRLEELSFAVRPYDNLTRQEVLAVINDAVNWSHTEADCFLCVFLSHGENECVFARDGKLSIRDLTHTFKGDRCPSLVGKPKIFIFQACRGDKHDEPVSPIVDVVDCEVHANQLVVDAGTVHTLPAGADFLMCYSVAEGYFSHRETVNGSWYIQDLCEVLQEYGTRLEITEMMTLVNRRVSLRRVENCADRNAIGKKQVPCYTSMLTKKLYFRSKKL
uniref:Caspase-6 n=3 Tax=Oncorhynchus TaxID=8016 RepID=A0A8K9UX51_ONCMY